MTALAAHFTPVLAWYSMSAASSSFILYDSSSVVLNACSSRIIYASSSLILYDSSSCILYGSSSFILNACSSRILYASSCRILRILFPVSRPCKRERALMFMNYDTLAYTLFLGSAGRGAHALCPASAEFSARWLERKADKCCVLVTLRSVHDTLRQIIGCWHVRDVAVMRSMYTLIWTFVNFL